MQKLHFLAATAVIMGTTACPTIDPTDDFDTNFTDLNNDDVEEEEEEEDEESTSESGTDDAETTDAETTDAETTDAETTDAETTDAETTDDDACGGLGCDCTDSSTCDAPLECTNGTCQIPGSEEETETTDTDTGGDDVWDPAMCMAPSMVLMVGALEGNFCSSPCVASMDCPAGPAGTQAQCALTVEDGAPPSFCALICQPAMDACGPGSSCKDLMDPGNPGLGLCTYP
jgi:hypothetical protein